MCGVCRCCREGLVAYFLLSKTFRRRRFALCIISKQRQAKPIRALSPCLAAEYGRTSSPMEGLAPGSHGRYIAASLAEIPYCTPRKLLRPFCTDENASLRDLRCQTRCAITFSSAVGCHMDGLNREGGNTIANCNTGQESRNAVPNKSSKHTSRFRLGEVLGCSRNEASKWFI